MNKVKKYVLFISIFLVIFSLYSEVLASDLECFSRDFSIHLNSDGSMKVEEVWYVSISELSTLSKEFSINNKFGEIKDVSVSELSEDNTKNSFTEIYCEMEKVTPNCYYALMNSKGIFEIAWGTGLKDSSARKKYQISYTVTDVVNTYNDCSDWGWKVIPENHANTIQTVTGTIYLPYEVEDIDSLRVWAHGPLNGNIKRVDKGRVSFEVNNVESDNFVEIRIATLEDIFKLNTNKKDIDYFDYILEEEEQFAKEANKQRIKSEIILAIPIIFFAIAIIKKIKAIKENRKECSKITEVKPTENYEYYTELPQKDMTAGDIAFIYYYKKGNFAKKISKVFSADILSLYLKNYINMNKDEKGRTVIEVVKKAENNDDIRRDELKVLNIFRGSSRKINERFSLKEFKNYIKDLSSEEMYDKYINIEDIIKKNASNNRIYSANNLNTREKYDHKLHVSRIVLVLVLILMLALIGTMHDSVLGSILIYVLVTYIILAVIDITIIKKVIKGNSYLTQKGTDYLEKIKGLKRYIEKSNVLEEMKDINAELWIEYIVCAMTLNISKKKIKAMVGEIPNIQINKISNNNWYDYYYLNSEASKITRKVNRAQFYRDIKDAFSGSSSGSNYSSGEGYGGGFSSGDAGFGGGGSDGGR